MGEWTGKKTLSLGILTLVILLSLWKLDFTGAMDMKMKIASSVLLPIVTGIVLWFKEPR